MMPGGAGVQSPATIRLTWRRPATPKEIADPLLLGKCSVYIGLKYDDPEEVQRGWSQIRSAIEENRKIGGPDQAATPDAVPRVTPSVTSSIVQAERASARQDAREPVEPLCDLVLVTAAFDFA